MTGVVPLRAGKHALSPLFFAAFATAVLQAYGTVKAAASPHPLNLSWGIARSSIDRAVERGLKQRDSTTVARLGFCKKNFGNG